MRILSYRECLGLKLAKWIKTMPHEYGKYLWVYSHFDDAPVADIRVYPDNLSNAIQRFSNVCCVPYSETKGIACLRMHTSSIYFLSTEEQKMLGETLSGMIYLKFEKPKDRYETGYHRGYPCIFPGYCPSFYKDNSMDGSLDYEYVFQAEEVKELETARHWFFKTWFEPPPGFVWETARVLESDLGAEHPMARAFRSMVFQKNENNFKLWERMLKKHNKRPYQSIAKRLVMPSFVGPDDYWRYCDNPHWVQTLLLARLIGGPWWTYALGALEALYGQVSDWTLLSNQLETQRKEGT